MAVAPEALARAAVPGLGARDGPRHRPRGPSSPPRWRARGAASDVDRLLAAADPAAAVAALAEGAEAVAGWWTGHRDHQIAVTGADLVGEGVAPGPAIGRALAAGARRDARRAGERAATSSSRWRCGWRAGSGVSGPEVIVVATDAPRGRGLHHAAGRHQRGRPSRSLNLGVERGDAPEAVRANRALVCEALGLDAVEVRMLHQVHGGARCGGPTTPTTGAASWASCAAGPRATPW